MTSTGLQVDVRSGVTVVDCASAGCRLRDFGGGTTAFVRRHRPCSAPQRAAMPRSASNMGTDGGVVRTDCVPNVGCRKRRRGRLDRYARRSTDILIYQLPRDVSAKQIGEWFIARFEQTVKVKRLWCTGSGAPQLCALVRFGNTAARTMVLDVCTGSQAAQTGLTAAAPAAG
jgi:hypothetical protein